MADAVELARELGFEGIAAIDPAQVSMRAELAALCTPKSCPKYGSCWSCPPGAGPFEDIQADVTSKTGGVLVQTVRTGIDYTQDLEEVVEAQVLHHERLDALADKLRATHKGVAEFSTGGCDLCDPCTYPDAPCAKPELRRLSLSAHGVDVGATCRNAGLDYAFENGVLRFIGMVLYEE